LEAFFNGAWSIFDVLEMNFADDGYPLEQMLRFVVAVESEFYPGIGALYEERIRAWTAARRASLGLDDEEADEPECDSEHPAPMGDMSELKTAAKLQDMIDELIRKTDKKDGYTS
jgi:hypothetical protein